MESNISIYTFTCIFTTILPFLSLCVHFSIIYTNFYNQTNKIDITDTASKDLYIIITLKDKTK